MAYSRHLPQVNDGPGLIVMASIFSLLSIVAVALRFRARQLTGQLIKIDDWLSVAAGILVLALNAIFIGGVAQGPITGHSPVVNNWPVSTPLEHLAQKYKYAFQSFEKPAFTLIKLSVLFLWRRFFDSVRWFSITCWVMIGVTIAWGISFTLATVFQCGNHWDWNWAPIGFFLTQCSNTLNMLTVFTLTDIVTDLIIIFLPVPVIWNLRMPMQKKIGVLSIFMVGFFTVGAGIARTYIYLVTSYDKQDNPDFIADFTLFILWSEIEVNVAMIVCCMPTLAPIAARIHASASAVRNSSIFSGRSKLLSTDKSDRGSTDASSQDDQANSWIRVSRSFTVEDDLTALPATKPQYIWDVEKNVGRAIANQ